MVCRISTLCDKEVVNINNGCRLGCIDDVEVNMDTAQICAVVIYGRARLFGLLGRCEDTVIRWEDISLIGEDTVLVTFQGSSPGNTRKKKQHGSFWNSFFES